MAGIKQIFAQRVQKAVDQDLINKPAIKEKKELTNEDIRKLLRKELTNAGRFNRNSMGGNMHRFFH
jgi:MerR family glutamine synthetase transcriptional repressor